jgi:hypothetical protein
MVTFIIARFYLLFAASSGCDKSNSFLGILPKWYKYLPYDYDPVTSKCEIKAVLREQGGINLDPLLPVGLAVLEMILRIAGLVAVIYVIYGAFKYITSQGEPDNTKNARETIINALIGAAIVVIASSVVAFIGNRIGG